MCFSIAVDKNINKLSEIFGARISAKDSAALQSLLQNQSSMDSSKFCEQLGLKYSEKKRATPFKMPGEDGRIFSNYFANIIIQERDERILTPMRYRVRPNGSKEEVPSKYNVFNARIDSLEARQTWSPLFMRNHGIIPFVNFFEWVSGPDGKPKLISFAPEQREIMWAPVLWDEWISKDGSIYFKSFAIITDEPAPEIQRMGHDRCPIFLEKEQIDQWLNPKGISKKSMYEILAKKENVTYGHSWVA